MKWSSRSVGLPTPRFLSLPLAKREREEELSRTLNKGPAPLWSTGGVLSLGRLIPNSPPCHLGTYALPPGQGHSPPIQCAGKSFLPPGISPAPWSGPGSQGDSRRQHRLGFRLARRNPARFRRRRRGAFFPPHPRRNQRLMIPSVPPRPPGHGFPRPLRPTYFQRGKVL